MTRRPGTGPLVVGVVAAVVLAAAVVLRAQNPPQFRGGVELVNVDVSVLDERRRPVRGLTARDFTVLVDGKTRPVVAFNAVDLPTPPAPAQPPSGWVREVPSDVTSNVRPSEGRLLVIVFDRSIRLEDQAIARRAAAAAIDALQPGDLGSVVFTSGFYKAGTVQGFTADRARLLEAIARPMIPQAVLPAIGDEGPSYPAGDCGACNLCAYDKLEVVARAIAEFDTRRKTILFLSNGTSPRCGLREAREGLTQALALSNATLHIAVPIGVEPLETDISRGYGFGSDALAEGTGGALADRSAGRWGELSFLAGIGGGRLVMEDNEPERFVPAIVEESASYYLLGFEPEDSTRRDGRLHRVEVKVNRPGVSILARKSYRYGETSDADRARDPRPPVVEALETTLPRTGIALQLNAMPFAQPGREQAAVLVSLRISGTPDGSGTEPATSSAADAATVTIAALDPVRGLVVDVTRSSVRLAPTGGGRGTQDLIGRLDLPPGRYEIRAAVDRISGMRGSVDGVLEVPRFEKEPVTMSGIALQVLGPSSAAVPPAAHDLIPIVPTATRRFTRSDLVTVFARTYQRADAEATTSPPAVVARIRDVTGAIRAEVQPVVEAGDIEFDVPVAGLERGDYVLSIEVGAGEHSAVRHVRFAME